MTRLVDRRWIEVAVDPVIDDRGELEGAVNIISDVDPPMEADNSLEKSKENQQAVPDSIIDTAQKKESTQLTANPTG